MASTTTTNTTSSSSLPSPPPKPAQGASIPDVEALAELPTTLPIRAWQASQGIDRHHQIKLVKLSHVRYQHPDLEAITTFLQHFGMTPVVRPPPHPQDEDAVRYFRGYGPDPYVYCAQRGGGGGGGPGPGPDDKKFLGACFLVESLAELEKAAARFGCEIRDLEEAEGEEKEEKEEEKEEKGGATAAAPPPPPPGGGKMVTVEDPEGFPLHLMWGQKERVDVEEQEEEEEEEEEGGRQKPKVMVLNYEKDKPRVRKFQRFREGPAAVHKLGHFGISTQKFPEMMSWYLSNFNLVPSDILQAPCPQDSTVNMPVTAFCHIDRGQDYVDHHSFFLGALPPGGPTPSHVHHCSFEVHDFDTQHLGHYWLAKKGYKSVWGVGRHILGSQIFDYWWDPSGNMVEHYADGDLVNEDTPIGVGPAGPEGLAIWGPEVPKAFLG